MVGVVGSPQGEIGTKKQAVSGQDSSAEDVQTGAGPEPQNKQNKQNKKVSHRLVFMKLPDKVRGVLRIGVSSILIIISLFLILYPILPHVEYVLDQLWGGIEYERVGDGDFDITQPNGSQSGTDSSGTEGNMLIIPAVGIDVRIVEGSTDKALDYGAWHRPGTGDPVSGSNMVITGHRFKYLPPSNLTFYHLDKVKVGDEVIVWWEDKEYEYTVEKKFEVTPDKIEVEAGTAEPQLTLYTCTPLWTARRRLIIVAKPVDLEDTGDTDVEFEKLDEEV